MITGKEVKRVASERGFRPEVVEKVLRLLDIMDRLHRHPFTKSAWCSREAQPSSRLMDRVLNEGVIEPELLDEDPDVQDRICKQPMLIWKARHVREHGRRVG